MKVKTTLRGNTKITLNADEAEHLMAILDVSHFIPYEDHYKGLAIAACEDTSHELCVALYASGVEVIE
jgi:hypothetical protein